MIATFSQMHLLIAALLMAGCGLAVVGTTLLLYFIYRRLEPMLGRRNMGAKNRSAVTEKPRSSHA
jgi:hypothetical protein